MKKQEYDVIVVGGGPAGMMASAKVAERGLSVLLIEKNDKFGNKLLLTGGGRCNLSNAILDNRVLAKNYGDDSKFLFSAFSQFSVKNTLDFFNSNGLVTKIEENNRVFPVADSAQTVLDFFVSYMKKHGVKFLFNSTVIDLVSIKSKVKGVKILRDGKEETILAKNIILSTGGSSYPKTGSTGDGFKWLEKLGHKIIKPFSALVPIEIKDDWVKSLQGTTLNNVKISVYQNNKKQFSKDGSLLFTHFGVSGPSIINMSREISSLMHGEKVEISIDSFINLNFVDLDKQIQTLFAENINKSLKNSLSQIVLPRFAQTIFDLLNINGEMATRDVTKEQRKALVKSLKDLRMEVLKLLPAEESIVAAGGVDPKEIDFKTMKSKIIPNLYLVGDILSIDRPSGGFSLQLCWTTGYIAGNSIG